MYIMPSPYLEGELTQKEAVVIQLAIFLKKYSNWNCFSLKILIKGTVTQGDELKP